MLELSLLQNFKRENLFLDPFPYIVVENALPNDLYEKLANEYPEQILNGATKGFRDFRYKQANFSKKFVTPLWQQFVDFHTSKMYKDQVIHALLPGMRKYYPEIADKYLAIDVSLRHGGKARTTAALEVQFVMNSADSEKIRTPHLDQAKELFACLFYMKKPEDKSAGGDLVIYKKLEKDMKFHLGRMAPLNNIEEAARIQYKANTLVIFLNSSDSVHGVSPRTNAEVFRRYVNVDCHIAEKLFSLDYLNE